MEKSNKNRLAELKEFVGNHRKILQIGFMLIVLVAVFFAIQGELKNLNLADLERLSRQMSNIDKLRFLVLGLFAFSFCSLYDFLFAHRFKLNVPRRELFSIGWIAQSFNNFIGFGGITGGTLRVKLYKNVGVEESVAMKLSAGILVSTLLGLFVLGIPAGAGLIYLGQIKYLPISGILIALVLLYLFGDKLPISMLRHRHSPLNYLSRRVRFEALAVSALEWLVAALFFAYALHYFDSGIPWSVGILVYTMATVVGIISLVPGGLGTFDGTVLALLTAMGFENSGVVMALLVERLIYTFIPWLLGVFHLSYSTFRKRFDIDNHLRLVHTVTTSIALGLLGCGLMLLISVIRPPIFWRLHLIYHYFPHAVPLISRALTGFFGILLIILSRGIRVRVKTANTIAILVLLAAIITSFGTSLNYEEALILFIFAVILLLSRSFFINPSFPLSKQTTVRIISAVSLITAIYLAIISFIQDMVPGQVVDGTFFTANAVPTALLLVTMALGISFATLTSRRFYLHFTPPTAATTERLQNIIDKYGGGMFAHLYHMGDKMVYFAADGEVAMLYRPVKNHILVLGDPLGDVEKIPQAIDELLTWADQKDMVVSFYEISGRHLVSYIDEGFRFLKLGEDASVSLTDFSLSGKKNRGLRHTRGVMEKEGYHLRVATPPHHVDDLQVWKTISDEWLDGRNEMQFSIGSFHVPYLQKAPVFELLDANDEVQAFATMMPDQEPGVLSIDLMRYRKSAPHAIMDMTFLSLFEWGKDQGYQSFDMGISPLANVGRAHYSDSREKLVRTAYEFGNRIYSFSGLHSFKNKFRPNWKPVYLAYKDNRILADVLLSLILMIHKKQAYDNRLFSEDDTINLRRVLNDSN